MNEEQQELHFLFAVSKTSSANVVYSPDQHICCVSSSRCVMFLLFPRVFLCIFWMNMHSWQHTHTEPSRTILRFPSSTVLWSQIKLPQSKTTPTNYCVLVFPTERLCDVTHIFIWCRISLPKWTCLGRPLSVIMWWLLWNSGWQRLRAAKRKEVIISLMEEVSFTSKNVNNLLGLFL